MNGPGACRTRRYADGHFELDYTWTYRRVHRRQDCQQAGPGLLDILLGIVGAIVGGYLFSLFGKEGVSGLNLYSMLVAVAGSVVVLLIYNALTGRRWT
jgi:uncharacterized membrane protein YeaQ/YmgE (transglycosylase-associated protein family)